MGAPKNYTVGAMVRKEDEPEVLALMEKYQWSRRVARDEVARRNFARKIKNAGTK